MVGGFLLFGEFSLDDFGFVICWLVWLICLWWVVCCYVGGGYCLLLCMLLPCMLVCLGLMVFCAFACCVCGFGCGCGVLCVFGGGWLMRC